MNTKNAIVMLVILATVFASCNRKNQENPNETGQQDTFLYQIEQFADIRIMRYQVPAFDALSLDQKLLVYYLSQASLCGRDILFDQHYKHNLSIRRTLEAIYESYSGERSTDEFQQFMTYLKKVWFANGIHHHYSNDKFQPGFSREYLNHLISKSDATTFPLLPGETIEALSSRIGEIIFDKSIAPVKVSQDASKDMVAHSAVNFYENISQKEVEAWYAKMAKPGDNSPLSYGLNSKLMKENGKIVEKVYKIGGMYSQAIEQIVFWLEKAAGVAENPAQKEVIESLISYYKTGDLNTWDEYNVLWVKDLESHIDFVNGFIEVYTDPLGRKATWESLVNFKDIEATKRATIISNNAQWFENHSPVDERFKKKEVKGVSAKVITAAHLGGDCYPSTPIGINLPNADWIRRDHGSKSVTIENITYSYNQASLGNGMLQEFCYSPEEIELAEKWGFLASNLHTDLHECLGHGSGQLLPGVSSEALSNYSSPLEEARADLYALYFMLDDKMIELGLMETHDIAKAAYNSYIRNGLVAQLTRLEPGADIMQAHMRSRQLIAKWCYEKGKAENVIERKERDGKTYFVVNDHAKLRLLFGQLLAEIQRVKSEGDYKAGKMLVETYGVKVETALHAEAKSRFEKLKLAPYGGFVNPVFVPVMNGDKITDIRIEYPADYASQMMMYSKKYSFLPHYN